jgi:hypothetical protein
MRIHVVTVIGLHVNTLDSWLTHYRRLGIDSFSINVNAPTADDPVIGAARRIAATHGIDLAPPVIGDWQVVGNAPFEEVRRAKPDDWWVIADDDEFHEFPDDLHSLFSWCDRKGYDHVNGCFIDRLSADGSFQPVDPCRPLETQYPLGGFVTFPMLAADPRKVVALKGRIPAIEGHHFALAGVACPIEDAFVPVHHYKWTGGVVQRLRARAMEFRRQGIEHGIESERFLKYLDDHDGRINVSDPRFYIGRCEPRYPHWPRILELAQSYRALASYPAWVRQMGA